MPQISIRPMISRDYAQVAELYRQRSCVENSLHTPFISEDEWRNRVLHMGNDLQCLVACIGEQLVGHCCLTTYQNEPRRRHAATVGVVVDQAHRRQGIARAMLEEIIDTCDNWLGVSRIELEVFVSNSGAMALYRQLDFAEEGRMRHYAYRNGVLEDAVIMARNQESMA